jgi:DNA polymerase III epsilon subunit-like protein
MKPIFVAFDTETTGLEPETCEVIEVAGVRFRLDEEGNPVKLGEYQSLVRIEGSIPPEASRINHIYDAMLTKAPKGPEAIGKFFRWVGPSAIMLAHHAAFDVSFLGNEIQRHGLMLPRNPIFCTKRMATRLLPEVRHRLNDLEEYLIAKNPTWLKVKNPHNQHRALYDSEMLMYVFAEMMKRRIPKVDWEVEKLLKVLPGLGGEKLAFDRPLNSHELGQVWLELKGMGCK